MKTFPLAREILDSLYRNEEPKVEKVEVKRRLHFHEAVENVMKVVRLQNGLYALSHHIDDEGVEEKRRLRQAEVKKWLALKDQFEVQVKADWEIIKRTKKGAAVFKVTSPDQLMHPHHRWKAGTLRHSLLPSQVGRQQLLGFLRKLS